MGASTTGGHTSWGPMCSGRRSTTGSTTASPAGWSGGSLAGSTSGSTTVVTGADMASPACQHPGAPPKRASVVLRARRAMMGPVRASGSVPADLRDPDDDSPKEACGVFGVFAPGQPVAHMTYLGLYALQHRGQEAAGMAVSDGIDVTVVKDMGLVAPVFDDRPLAPLGGHAAIGHTRYSTTGSSTWRNAQPVYRDAGLTQFALGHNGNLVNTGELAEEAGMLPGTVASDSDLVAELLALELERAEQAKVHDPTLVAPTLDVALMAVLPHLQGAFSLVLMDEHRIIGLRDPNGFRPLCLG